jgi:TatD DNase family protein
MIDSHCHLADEAFAADLDGVVLRARAAGVADAMCILSADEPDELARAEAVARAWPGIRFAAAIHPHRAGAYAGRAEAAAAVTREALARTAASAVGEIGLDYHYDFAPREVQRDVFAAQIGVALELDRAVVIHTREATDDTIAIIRESGQGRLRGVMHCFTGSSDEARRALDLGFFVSFAGILTFPKAAALRETAALVPIDRVLVETDAPFLAPVPHRGKRCEPAWVVATAASLAAVHRLDRETLDQQLTRNLAALLGGAA